MGTPLQQRSYELTLRVANIWLHGQGAGHSLDIHRGVSHLLVRDQYLYTSG
jgi:hypothetical protein